MAYQKTAKDKAWDRERLKLKGEITEWICKYGMQESRIQEQQKEILTLANRVRDLEEVIAKLTNGKISPDEAIEGLRSATKISEMAKFIMGWERGGYF